MQSEIPLSPFIKEATFVAFDTETTGLWAPVNRIVEIAAVKFSVISKEAKSFQALVNPGMPIPPEVIEIHGITDEMVIDQPKADVILKQFTDFCDKDSILLAHNAAFDISFVGCELDRASLPILENPILDTVDIFKRFQPDHPSYSLLSLCRHYNICESQDHRALSDAQMVRKLFIKSLGHLSSANSLEVLSNMITVHKMEGWHTQEARLPIEFDLLNKAVDNGLRVEITYQAPARTAHKRIIRPKHIYKLGKVYYINSYCEYSKDERTFRLDRMTDFVIMKD